MLKEIKVPDIGAYKNVEVIEVLVALNDIIAIDAALITLETDKASMEIPSPFAGKIKSINVKVGDKVSEGDLILTLEISEQGKKEETESKTETKQEIKPETVKAPVTETVKEVKPQIPERVIPEKVTIPENVTTGFVHAGPGVRRFARELGVNLSNVSGTGRNNRIVLSDVKKYVKEALKTGASSGSGLNLAAWPQIDHAKFGEVVKQPVSRIKKLSGSFLHRNWVMVPHVTQFDEADITEMEKFRKESQRLAEAQNIKLTPLVFIMKALVSALKMYPIFNASLDASGSEIILKNYFHMGVAVDTPNGLVVPVVRNVDQKGLFELAKELGELSAVARAGKLSAESMQGSSFSISSLGGIGGTYFTPIINVPDVAILGVSKAQVKPIYIENEFMPRLMLPLSLSYDHRVIDGAEAARFITYLVQQLSDVRRLLL